MKIVPRMALILGIFLMGILLVPGIVQDVEANTGLSATFIIGGDSNGGACTSSTFGGVWNDVTKTCTMTKDLVGSGQHLIAMNNGGVTLDGAGYKLTGTQLAEDSAEVGKGNAAIIANDVDDFVIKITW